MKLMTQSLSITILLAGLMILNSGCSLHKGLNLENKDIKCLEYNYGSYFGGEYEFSIYYEGETPYLLAKGYNGVMLNYKQELTEEDLKKLAKNLVDADVAAWNGFDKRANSVSDGYSFKLDITYWDDTILQAHGYMKYPKNYNEVDRVLKDFFFGMIEEHTDFNRDEPGKKSAAYDESLF